MARVAALLNLGVLVIDEIQNLRGAKVPGRRRRAQASAHARAEEEGGGAAHEMLRIGLPVVLIGTYAAQPVLSG